MKTTFSHYSHCPPVLPTIIRQYQSSYMSMKNIQCSLLPELWIDEKLTCTNFEAQSITNFFFMLWLSLLVLTFSTITFYSVIILTNVSIVY